MPWVAAAAEREADQLRDARLAGERDQPADGRRCHPGQQGRGTDGVVGGHPRDGCEQRLQLIVRDPVEDVEQATDVVAVEPNHHIHRPVESMGELDKTLEAVQQLRDAGLVLGCGAGLGEVAVEERQDVVCLPLQA